MTTSKPSWLRSWWRFLRRSGFLKTPTIEFSAHSSPRRPGAGAPRGQSRRASLAAAGAIALVFMAAGAGAGIWWARSAGFRRLPEAPEPAAVLPLAPSWPARADHAADVPCAAATPDASGSSPSELPANQPVAGRASIAEPERSRAASEREASAREATTRDGTTRRANWHRASSAAVSGARAAASSTATGTRAAAAAPATPAEHAAGLAPAASDSSAEGADFGEWALLSAALEQVKARDYERALETLKQHETRYPHGVLENEIRLTKLSALTKSGRMGEALSILESTTLTGPRMLDMLVLRGELRTHAGRYEPGADDFGRALLAHPRADLEERALYGRAVCRAHLGDRQGARRDAHEYLAKYAGERRASEVQRILGL